MSWYIYVGLGMFISG